MSKVLRWIFVGSNGIRAAWRLLIYAAIIAVIYAILTPVIRHIPAGMDGSVVRPWLALSDLTGSAVTLFAAWLMSRVEHRPLYLYGLPFREAFRGKFWIGSLFGIVAITAILLCLFAAGAFRINALATTGIDALEAAVLWALVFVLAGLFEEFLFRGYVQFTLTTGAGFWIASAITSLLFGLLHSGNHGENALGIISVVCFALFHCVTLRQTGNLWMSIGFHATWDWCESFLYGVPDSGTTTWHPLFTTTFKGPVWLTGGNDGPEGSALALLAVFIMTLLVFWLYPTSQYRTKLGPASAN